MKITIVTVGTWGDIQPYLALGVGLQRSGDQVCMAVPPQFEREVASRGLFFSPLRYDLYGAVLRAGGQAMLESGRFPAERVPGLWRALGPLIQQGMADCLQAAEGAEVMIVTINTWPLGQSVAERKNLPLVRAFYSPATPTRAFPYPDAFVEVPFEGILNRASFKLVEQVLWQAYRPHVNKARRTILGLPALGMGGPLTRMNEQHWPVLYGFSPSILRPADWGEWIHVTGYWFLERDREWTPPEEVMEFLASGPPPVFVGFGSMTSSEPGKLTELVLNALARSRQRGILVSGWGGLAPATVPGWVYSVANIPYDWLLPQVALAIHHGGSGTTGAACRAGIPSIVVSHLFDQPFWGRTLAAIGVGPEPIPRSRLTADRLAAAIASVLDSKTMRARAHQLGAAIRKEDGIDRAVQVIHRQRALQSRDLRNKTQ